MRVFRFYTGWRFIACLVAAVSAVLLTVSCDSDDNLSEDADVASGVMPAALSVDAGIVGAVSTRAYDDVWEKGDMIGVARIVDGEVDDSISACYITEDGDGYFDPYDDDDIVYLDDDEWTICAVSPWDPDMDVTGEKTYYIYDQEDCAFDYLYGEDTASRSDPDASFVLSHMMTKLVLRFYPGEDMTFDDIKDGEYSCYTSMMKFTVVYSPEFSIAPMSSIPGETFEMSPLSTASEHDADPPSHPYWYDEDEECVCFSLILVPEVTNDYIFYLTVDGISYTLQPAFNYANMDAGYGNNDIMHAGLCYYYDVKLNRTNISCSSTIVDWEESDTFSFYLSEEEE